jgi:predicted MFS family arabinose efflux permease
MHPTLRRLLLAEVFKRWCDWMVRDFVSLYLVLVRGVSVEAAGVLFAVQHLTALATYLPIGRLTSTVGLQPFIGVTFVFFALFPLALALVPGGDFFVLAFVINGLREVGEPARKALITSLLPEGVRARGVGLYWGLRSFAICPASLAGAAIWYARGPQVLLYAASAFGCVGAAVFYLLVRSPAGDPAGREAHR